jgi:riboflavin synthase alpha subunit
MFTGIIEGLGKVKSARLTADSMRLSVELGEFAASMSAVKHYPGPR